jgi:hypothetical protein
MAKVREYRSLISMDASALIIDQQTTQYTVVLHESEHLHVSPAHCIVYVVPGSKEGIIEEITNAKLLIQGIALASENIHSRDEWKRFSIRRNRARMPLRNFAAAYHTLA